MSTLRSIAGFIPGIIFGTVLSAVVWLGPDLYPKVMNWLRPAEQRIPIHVEHAPLPAGQPQARIEVQPVTPRQEPSRAAEARARAREALQSLARTCAFWSARDSDSSGKFFREKACSDMREYAARTGQKSPRINKSGASPDTREGRRRKPAARSVVTNDCGRHEKGSIAYRGCRARENHRLKQACYFYRERQEWQKAEPWCTAYRHYPIID